MGHSGLDVTHLLHGFVSACTAAGARAPVVDIEAAGMDLLHRWAASSRGYHDVEHLAEVLERLRGLRPEAEPATWLAAWFHDAVYEGEPGEDEERSAELASAELGALGVPGAQCRRVASLVRMTSNHEPLPGDEDAAALSDADLAVLASPPERYDRYLAGVRHEYGHLDEGTFRAGRAAVLRSLLSRREVFRTALGKARWEAAARQNLTSELERLEPVDG